MAATLLPSRYTLWPRFLLRQSLGAALMGALLGLIVLVATTLDFKLMALLLAPVAGACLAVIAGSILGSVEKLLLFAMMVEIPLQIDLNLAHDELMAFLVSISGFSISATTFCLVILYALWGVEIVRRRRTARHGGQEDVGRHAAADVSLLHLSLPLLVYIALTIFSVFQARNVVQSIFEINLLVQGLLLYFMIIHITRTRGTVWVVIAGLLVGLFLESVIIYGVAAVGTTVDLGVMTFAINGDGRVAGTTGSPNVTASYLSLLIVLTFSLLVTPLHVWGKRLAVVLLVIAAGALVLTGSRGGWISTFVALSLFYFFNWRRGWLSLWTPILGVFAAVPVLFFLREMILARVFGDDNGSAESRLPLIRLALKIIRDHWLLGVGANNFATNIPLYASAEFTGFWIRTVHNKYLLVWAETGILGLISFLWFMTSTIRRGWQVWGRGDRFLSPLGLALGLGLFGWMLHMGVAVFNGRPNIFGYMVAAALIVSLYRILEQEDGML